MIKQRLETLEAHKKGRLMYRGYAVTVEEPGVNVLFRTPWLDTEVAAMDLSEAWMAGRRSIEKASKQ